MTGKSNSRRNARVYCGAPARAEGPRGPVKGLCRDLSMGGMFFLGPQLPVGKTVEFTLELPQMGKVLAQGEIRYHHDYGQEGGGMGVRFVRISQDDLGRVTRFVDARA